MMVNKNPGDHKQLPTRRLPNKDVSSIKIGDMFNHYQIQQELGRGGMGVVYKVFDTKLQRVVALKLILSPHISAKEVARFSQEVEATAKLDHPNIIKLFEVGNTPTSYFTMEYIAGYTLSSFLKNKGIQLNNVVQILHKVAGALHEAHKKGIIHRDIKPSNIMIDQNNQPKVMDFGLAKIAKVDNQVSKTGDLLGTPAYMPPEQANGKKIDKRVDIYSLGATLYEALTGCPPFQGETYFNILTQIFTKDPIAPREINPDTPRELEAICLKCLEKSREKRYANARLLEKDLKNFLENRPVSAKPPTQFTYLKKFILRNKLLCGGALFVFVAAIVVVCGYLIVTHTHNFRLQEEKERAVQAREIAEEERKKAEQANKKLVQEKAKVQRERKNSIQAARTMFEALCQVYIERPELQILPKLTRGLKTVFKELERLDVLKELAPNEDYQDTKILWLYSLVYSDIEGCNLLIRNNPKNPQVYINRGSLYHRQKQYAKAEQDFNKAIELNANDSTIYVSRGIVYADQGLFVKAEQDFNKAIELNANDPQSYIKRGMFYALKRQPNKAIADWRQAITLDPSLKNYVDNLRKKMLGH